MTRKLRALMGGRVIGSMSQQECMLKPPAGANAMSVSMLAEVATHEHVPVSHLQK